MLKAMCFVGWLMLLSLAVETQVLAGDATERGFALMNEESLDGIRLGMGSREVEKRLGKAEKGRDELWEATGEYVQSWEYPEAGLKLQMAAAERKGARRVLAVQVAAPGKGLTERGVKLGATEAEVRKHFGAWEDRESGEPGRQFVAGTPYGGLIFTFANGKVTGIFLGAAAE